MSQGMKKVAVRLTVALLVGSAMLVAATLVNPYQTHAATCSPQTSCTPWQLYLVLPSGSLIPGNPTCFYIRHCYSRTRNCVTNSWSETKSQTCNDAV
jgi:hypothetical protein